MLTAFSAFKANHNPQNNFSDTKLSRAKQLDNEGNHELLRVELEEVTAWALRLDNDLSFLLHTKLQNYLSLIFWMSSMLGTLILPISYFESIK